MLRRNASARTTAATLADPKIEEAVRKRLYGEHRQVTAEPIRRVDRPAPAGPVPR